MFSGEMVVGTCRNRAKRLRGAGLPSGRCTDGHGGGFMQRDPQGCGLWLLRLCAGIQYYMLVPAWYKKVQFQCKLCTNFDIACSRLFFPSKTSYFDFLFIYFLISFFSQCNTDDINLFPGNFLFAKTPLLYPYAFIL